MAQTKTMRKALISVYHKEGLDEILAGLNSAGVTFISTGGTRAFIESLGYPCEAVEDLTGYPSILGGRVKTLHPKVFGGILGRRDNADDVAVMESLEIPGIDLVIVDLYPFEATVASGASHEEIIEKIDIGGISLIRAAAKNFADVAIVASKEQYSLLLGMIHSHGAETTLEERALLAREAFAVSSGYDSAIFDYMASCVTEPAPRALRLTANGAKDLRYGENPHQQGRFYGDFDAMFEQLHGKEISYNNLLDIDAATALVNEFDGPAVTCAILKHNNACGLAVRGTLVEAWKDALAGDPVSAFGGVIVTNAEVDATAAAEIDKIFFEVIIAPGFSEDAMAILCQKKNRIILRRKPCEVASSTVRTVLNGYLVQQRDHKTETPEDLKIVAGELSGTMAADMLFANKIVKHCKSNAIVIARDGMLLGAGVGQTSRVDALRHAIEKAAAAGLSTEGAVMASDAFFPFADCVEIAHQAGVNAVIQPGGSIRDTDSVEYCREHGITMAMTGFRHFRH